jgi:hypothetical protein
VHLAIPEEVGGQILGGDHVLATAHESVLQQIFQQVFRKSGAVDLNSGAWQYHAQGRLLRFC